MRYNFESPALVQTQRSPKETKYLDYKRDNSFLARIAFSLLGRAYVIPSKQRRRRTTTRMKELEFPSLFQTGLPQPQKDSLKYFKLNLHLVLALLNIRIAQYQHCTTKISTVKITSIHCVHFPTVVSMQFQKSSNVYSQSL